MYINLLNVLLQKGMHADPINHSPYPTLLSLSFGESGEWTEMRALEKQFVRVKNHKNREKRSTV